jgi:hypothetical protein
MRTRHLFSPAFFVATAVAFGCGWVSARTTSVARADPALPGSTVYIPAEGLSFRTIDGHLVAKLSRNTNGGVFELFDDKEGAIVRLSAGSSSTSVSSRPPSQERQVETLMPALERNDPSAVF